MQNFNSKVKPQGVKRLTTNENNPEHLEVAFTAEIFTTYSYHERQHFVKVSVAPHVLHISLCFLTLSFIKTSLCLDSFPLLTENYTMFFRSSKFKDGMKSHSLGIMRVSRAAKKSYKGDNVICKQNNTSALCSSTLSHYIIPFCSGVLMFISKSVQQT